MSLMSIESDFLKKLLMLHQKTKEVLLNRNSIQHGNSKKQKDMTQF